MNDTSSQKLAIVTALACEAKPIINLCKLKKLDIKSPFPIYHHENIYLIVSGIGKLNSALAVATLNSHLADTYLTWLNIGIGGHKDCEVGSIFMAHKIIDQGIKKNYYPTFLAKSPIPSSTICTVEKPETNFDENHIYEMEAAGFMHAALKFSTTEYIHCCKIISDNLKTKVCFNSCSIQSLIETRLLEIAGVIEYLKNLKMEIKMNFSFKKEEFTEHWHFTVTETHQLERLLNRFACLNMDPISKDELSHLRKAKEVLIELENKINLYPLCF